MSSYRQIFKSTALIGATQAANIVIGILRTKALAMLLGPAGLGLAGTYLTATGFIGGVAGLGLGASGVRQIAEASASGDEPKIARTVFALRRASLLAGVLGMLVLLALSTPLSRATFGNDSHSGALAIMSLTLLFSGISAGQLALLQGLRRLLDLAKAQVAGAFFGAIGSVLLVYFLRERGVAPFLVANAALAIMFSYWYARKIQVQQIKMTLWQTFSEIKGLLSLGVAFVLQNLLLGLGAYLSRVLIISQLGLAAVGLYTATWTLSSYYVNIVLKAMGADFYPRLTASANDHTAMNRLVNEQIEMGLLIAVPGILGIMAVAHWVLQAFYSGAFVGGSDIIRWQLLGVLLQVVSWPLGYVQLAKARGRMYVVSEAISASLGVGSLFVLARHFGLEGIGVASALSGLVFGIYLFMLSRRMVGFAFSRRCLKVLLLSFLLVSIAFLVTKNETSISTASIGLALASVAALGSFFTLQKLLGVNVWRVVRSKIGFGYCAG